MGIERIKLTLTELRCLAQSEGRSGSEPYLWTTFFAFGGERLPFQTGNLAFNTPAYDAFRTEFPDGMTAGKAAPVPPFIASAHFDMDLSTAPQPKLVGCVAVLMEENASKERSMVAGRIAYSKEIEAQLEALVSRRIQTQDYGDITDEEVAEIRGAVEAKVRSAVRDSQSLLSHLLGGTPDAPIGFTYALFRYPKPADSGRGIEFQYVDFPEIASSSGGDRYVLTGRLSVEAVPRPTITICGAQRGALDAKQHELEGLHRRRGHLQASLHASGGPHRAGLADAIEETNAKIAEVEGQIPALQAALDACMGADAGGRGRLP